MKKLLYILSVLFLFTGCIFQPPSTVNNSITIYEDIDTYADLGSDDLLLDESKERLLSLALAQMGTPYVYGGADRSGFDCSGFVNYIYKHSVGKKLPRTSRSMSKYATRILRDELIPGDIVFFDTSRKGRVNHCGIYMGQGRFIHASSGKAHSVTTSNLDSGFYKKRFKWGGRVSVN